MATDSGEPNKGSINKPRLYDLAEDTCPNCGKPMDPDAVVCVSCGYDLAQNKVIKPDTSSTNDTSESDNADETEPQSPFVEGSPKAAKAFLITGCVFFIAALVLAGINRHAAAESVGWTAILFAVLHMAYQTLFHSATGVAAIAIVAALNEQRLGQFEIAAARMFFIFALFQTIWQIPIPVQYVATALAVILALLVYWLALMATFRIDRLTAGMIMLAHALLYLLIELGTMLHAAAQG